MQLQIAMALSREECEKEEEARKSDAIRLQVNFLIKYLFNFRLLWKKVNVIRILQLKQTVKK